MAVGVPLREIAFRAELRGASLAFSATWGLFSPKGIDAGTHLLIEHLEIQKGDTCLDLGCGYGAIGLTLAKCVETSTVYMVDKDFVAVDYARKNVEQNRLQNCHVLLSNGFSHLPDIQFDLIVSNFPANVGKELLQIFLADAPNAISNRTDGSMWSRFRVSENLSSAIL